MIDLELGISLREQGMTYIEIAKELGCSVVWCKVNLKDVSKNKGEKEILKEIILQSRTKEGITEGQIRNIARKLYPFNTTKEFLLEEKKIISRFKAHIRKDPESTIRPHFMKPENSIVIFHNVLNAVNEVNERITSIITEIRRENDMDDSYEMSLRYAIIKMLYGSSMSDTAVITYCNYLEKTSNKLDELNT
jgi:hypothetical protein